MQSSVGLMQKYGYSVNRGRHCHWYISVLLNPHARPRFNTSYSKVAFTSAQTDYIYNQKIVQAYVGIYVLLSRLLSLADAIITLKA